jgi:hypothetical protein
MPFVLQQETERLEMPGMLVNRVQVCAHVFLPTGRYTFNLEVCDFKSQLAVSFNFNLKRGHWELESD